MLEVEMMPIQDSVLLKARGSELLILPHHVFELKKRTDPKSFSQYFLYEALINRPARKLFEAWLRKDRGLWSRVFNLITKEMELSEETVNLANEKEAASEPVQKAKIAADKTSGDVPKAKKDSEKPTDKPAERKLEKPAERKPEKPAEKQAAKPVEKKAEKSVEKPAAKPIEKQAPKPIEKTAKKSEKPAVKEEVSTQKSAKKAKVSAPKKAAPVAKKKASSTASVASKKKVVKKASASPAKKTTKKAKKK